MIDRKLQNYLLISFIQFSDGLFYHAFIWWSTLTVVQADPSWSKLLLFSFPSTIFSKLCDSWASVLSSTRSTHVSLTYSLRVILVQILRIVERKGKILIYYRLRYNMYVSLSNANFNSEYYTFCTNWLWNVLYYYVF